MKRISIERSSFYRTLAAAGAAAVCLLAASPSRAESPVIHHNDPTMASLLNDARSAYPEIPGIAAAVIIDNDIYLAARGVRFRYSVVEVPLQETDAFQLGSVSKALTGALLAKEVDLGNLSWNTTLAASLPDLFLSVPSFSYLTVTAAQLSAHTSGTPYDTMAHVNHVGDAADDYASVPDLVTRRLNYAHDAVLDTPLFSPGTGVSYDGSHILAVAMMERATGNAYEDLMEALLFAPLGMTHAKWTPDAVEHSWSGSGAPIPHDSAAVGLRSPVDGVSASIEDVARFAHMSLWRPQDATHFYSASARDAIRTAVKGSNYSPGFAVNVNNRAGGLELGHTGSNGSNWSIVAIWPNRKMAIVVLTNYAHDYDAAGAGWVYNQIANYAGIAWPNVIPQAFPSTGAATYHATQATAVDGNGNPAVYSAAYAATKAFDGDYGTRWAAPAGVTNARLNVTLPAASTVSSAVINEAGPLPKAGTSAKEFRVQHFDLYVSAGTTTYLAASGDHIGPNLEIPLNHTYYGITSASLHMQGTNGPTLSEFHLLP
ncbi:serine hydrolase [Polyangium sorediatum]|uniref:Serine hydrolase n=1 Tax=Polyangium sorediatum TaxID=889274 RepID=A0ABT6P4C5_9BACT|nr:serine hydrolase [Polyangium sorediatum]MDI1435384.1 serine hydrolase [Polyangium sorediatum]